MKNYIALGILVCALPLSVHAATADELAAQIQALLQQVNALSQQVGGGTPTPTPTPTSGSVTTAPRTGAVQCPLISRNLKKGMSGADVTRLQQFLALDPSVYPNPQVTGYYGALTEAAVKRFQCKNKLVCEGDAASTGYGVTGPRTAALLALQCSDAASPGASGFVRLLPMAGPAPLSVVVEATVNTARSCVGATYEILFGDVSAPSLIVVPQNGCTELRQSFNHVYTSPGTYSVILRSGTHQVSGTVTVSAAAVNAPASPANPPAESSTGGGAFSVTAGVGGNPLALTAQFDLSRTCGKYELNWGDGTASEMQAEGSCAAGVVSKQLSHTYAQGGSYTLTLQRGTASPTNDQIGITISAY